MESPFIDRIWGIWGSYYNIPKAIFYLLQGDYKGLSWPNKDDKASRVIQLCRVIIEKEMKTTILYRGYIGVILEKQMETGTSPNTSPPLHRSMFNLSEGMDARFHFLFHYPN